MAHEHAYAYKSSSERRASRHLKRRARPPAGRRARRHPSRRSAAPPGRWSSSWRRRRRRSHRGSCGWDRRAGGPTRARSRRRGPAQADRGPVRAGAVARSKPAPEPSEPGPAPDPGARSPADQAPAAFTVPGPSEPGSCNGAAGTVRRGPVAAGVRITSVGRRARRSARRRHRRHRRGREATVLRPRPPSPRPRAGRRAGAQAAAPPGHDHAPLARNDQVPGSPHGRTSCPSHPPCRPNRCHPPAPGRMLTRRPDARRRPENLAVA